MITPDWLTALSTAGTFVVIAASAVAALLQLRHMRSGNQIQAYNECRESMERPEFREALEFIFTELPSLFEDPELVHKIKAGMPGKLGGVRHVGNLFESMGLFVARGIMDKDIACELWSGVALRSWNALAPMIELVRQEVDPGVWLYFEYMASISRDYSDSPFDANFPRSARRMPVDDSLVKRLNAQKEHAS